ncbi:Bgt-1357 [Blumeria graminis f. sp. tritici]|uniref:Orotate phosphoribosyltransferase n=2 Tax=Blumeria graminis f. sp. tritici TaxID=62690 RepID=A0A061HJM2_BLUGR|nr:orotate phosphoribosyltransferase (OPRTase) isozyme [Blumeria graminis f. sp. tritici 96224]VCU39534.1 Bgt-1357 [Blumeria graminis f. sp. tritici]
MLESKSNQYKLDFLKAALEGQVLKFGTYKLKSGRASPYFFNAGEFHRADLLRALSTAFALTILDACSSGPLPEFDIIFGPAYKGIPLATATVARLAELDPVKYSKICYSFDRKEAKDHGEGKIIVGAPLKGKRVLIVDDVVTAGTAKREAIARIRQEGGHVVGIVVALDRMEKIAASNGDEDLPMPSAIGQLKKEYDIPILAILTLEDIIDGLGCMGMQQELAQMQEYGRKYQATD